MRDLSYEAASAHLERWCDSYERLPTVLRLRRQMAAPDWWRLLGAEWSGFDNVGRHTERLRAYLLKANPTNLQAMMQRHERRAIASMPEVLTVYRGCYRVNAEGLSWTLCRKTATRFPTMNRYRRPEDTALLLTGTTLRTRAVLKLDRGECEVICPAVKVLHEQRIDPA
jgi:hypothetical protein